MEQVNFYQHLQVKNATDGRIHLPPTFSPEYAVAPDCNYDNALYRYALSALVDAIEYKLARDDLRWAKECYSNEEAKMGQAVVEADEAVVEELAAGGSSTQQSFDLPEASKPQPRA